MKTPTNVPSWRFPAFTLVELIVVITIVGILSTVGFVSYSGYLTGARDSNRFSQLTKLSDSLQVYAATKSLPLPDDYIELQSSGSTIAYQGYVGTDVLETIDYTNGGLDPKDDSYFTYMLSRDRKALQLLAFMERSAMHYPQIKTTYAVDYVNRYPVTYGQKLWVLTDTDNNPLQDITLINNILDISNVWSLTLKSYLNESQFITGSGTDFSQLSMLIPQKGRFWKVDNNRFSCSLEALPTIGYQCIDIIYAGRHLGTRIYTTANDQGNMFWGQSNGVTNATSVSDGFSNTNILVALTDSGAPFDAAISCRSLGDEWYLPSRDELQVLYDNRLSIGGFNMDDNFPSNTYWTSTETTNKRTHRLRFSDGCLNCTSHNKSELLSFRCIRK